MTLGTGLEESASPHLFMRLEYRFLDLKGLWECLKSGRWKVPRK